jgi:hypothetical protein
MNKVYIITAGSYSDKHIVAVFMTRKEAEQFCDAQNSKAKWDSQVCMVNEYPIGADISLAGKELYCAYEGVNNGIYAYGTCENIFDYAYEIGVVTDNGYHLECYVSVDMSCDEPEEYARKVAADLFAEYKARKEGIT